jgi:hypothetical protein|tara:strand:+ start:4081 stop:5832 length:1752 start_codon:yes stop_codon:yes gene_type:complete
MPGLSSEWRITRSKNQVIELANVLASLKKVIGGISPNTENIVFDGMSYNTGDGKTIAIDKKFAINPESPLPDNQFDILVGLASHEAGHSNAGIMWPRCLHDTADRHKSSDQFGPDDFLSTAEEIYVDQMICKSFPVNYQYLSLARLAYSSPTINTDNINQVWLNKAVYNIQPGDTPADHAAVHTILDSLTQELSTRELDIYQRHELYEKVYDAILSLLDVQQTKDNLSEPSKGQMPDSLKDQFEPSDTPINSGSEPENTEDEDSENEESNKPQEPDNKEPELEDSSSFHNSQGDDHNNYDLDKDQELIEQVEKAIESGIQEISEELSKQVEDLDINPKDKEIIRDVLDKTDIIWQKAESEESNFILVPSFLKQLEWVNRIKNTFLKERIRGEPEGILDRRRLHRMLVSPNIYKKNHTRDRQKLDLVLLLDASGSMNSQKHREIYRAAEALYKIVPEAKVYSYGTYGDLIINNLVWDNKFHHVETYGGTPSGAALMATGLQNPNSLIIHFTDGGQNGALNVQRASTVLEAKSPKTQIVNILLNDGGHIPGYDDLPDNSITQHINSVDEFPAILKKAAEPWFKMR